MHDGECWYLDLSLPHWVENRGSTDRVHLVIDCELNEWLRGLIPAPPPADALEYVSSPEEFRRFHDEVLADLKLQDRLRQTADRESFIRLVIRTGQEHGYRFAPADVEGALQVAQRAWIERWID